MTEDIKNNSNLNIDKNYLNDLLLNLQIAHDNNIAQPFKIVASKKGAFLVKVGGLFAIVSFNHFAWRYPSLPCGSMSPNI